MKKYIIIYDDGQGCTAPMQWDAGCKGAVHCIVENKIAVFPNRQSARKAIDISAKYAALRRSQGLPENTDFLEGRKFLRVVELEPSETRKEAVNG